MTMTDIDKEKMCEMIARGSSKASADAGGLNYGQLSSARTGDIQQTVDTLGSFLDRSEFNIDVWEEPEVETLRGEGIGGGLDFEPEMTGTSLENHLLCDNTLCTSTITGITSGTTIGGFTADTSTLDVYGDLNVSGNISLNGGTVTTFYQESEPENPNTGDLWFNQYRNSMCYWNGTSWGYFLVSDLGDTSVAADSEVCVNTDDMYVDPSQFMEPDTIAHDTRTEYVIRDKSSDQFLSTDGTLSPDLRDIQIFTSMKEAENVRRAFDHPMEYDVRPLVISLTVLG